MYIANNDYRLSYGIVNKGDVLKYESTMIHGNGKKEVIFKVGRKLHVVSEEEFELMTK